MIEARNLHKRFGSVTAVHDVTFTAEDGVITGLLGPNGAGKTTTMRMLYTLVRPDGGTATVDGVDVAKQPEVARRALGVLPDARGLYPRLTAREHARYFGELHGLSGAALDARVEELVELLDMKDIADRRTEGFSQGERVKVALARALVHGPRNVLLDEPTNGLDVMATRSVRTLLRKLKAQGCCVVFSSHVMQEVAALCDRIVVVARGRVVADGTADALRASTGKDSLEEAFVSVIGSEQGLRE
ncbi:ATP-binding cassette domain-containing protein [Corallococcus exiguus]|uniref:ATP-binding cassette domain-containing protein n=1 Tax=Corallococcus exiguus TaxID=83462 RepID=A0A7Y1RPW6_9BACT|nr:MULTISPECIES: ATP-binding cassette domain-containing protein [Corallococcus]RKI36291.1 ATP-binding cassette domain-containing protein [Corallococcus sp. AB004]MBN8472970.1 ATP-binding cassette domain-containing protein [Corallococcus exiguus]NBC42533.1 ATP-binding cassette domain-containing protein [Corallococcus exiguus]NNB88375.1 ATP-binding cassette domain-containing protein [Corallococcus exiguus]NNB96269.1 ATP-binding cassette domain-containing protein [Corallococcus exiguus]